MLVLRALVPLALLQQEVDLVKLASRILVLCETRCVSLLAMKADAFAGAAFTTAGRMSGGFLEGGHGGGGNTREPTGA